ncbi:MAG: portal protein, partial [Dehalococcoidia bacterium]|nr:portal protein [Dehalococcoidia bacterium]
MNQPTLPQLISRMDSERLRRYRDNLAFYNGAQWQGRARPGERRLTFNYAKVVVDKVVSYLLPGMNTIVEPVD